MSFRAGVVDQSQFGNTYDDLLDALAVMDAPTKSYIWYFPAGKYYIEETLVVPQRVHICGDGPNLTELVSLVDGEECITVADLAWAVQHDATRFSDFRLSGVDTGVATTSATAGISVSGNTAVTMENLLIADFRTVAAQATKATPTVAGMILEAPVVHTVKDCFFSRNDIGLLVQNAGGTVGTSTMVERCRFRENGGHAIKLDETRGIEIRDCLLEQNYGATTIQVEDSATDWHANLVIRGCWFESNQESITKATAGTAEIFIDVDTTPTRPILAIYDTTTTPGDDNYPDFPINVTGKGQVLIQGSIIGRGPDATAPANFAETLNVYIIGSTMGTYCTVDASVTIDSVASDVDEPTPE